ncbi:MAG: ABC transporter permease [Hespellia sp.]|nr:ABC transporter permease [Hespellia sp.]
MKILIWAERKKLRRSKIVLTAVFATVMVAVIVFAQGQFVFNGSRYVDSAGWFMTTAQSLATFYVLPAVIALVGSYMICREEQEDTQKSLHMIPIDETRLTTAKMIVLLAFSVLIYLLLFVITFLCEVVLHFEALTAAMIFTFFKVYLLDGIGVFLAVAPIVALVAWIKKSYWLALVFAEIYSFTGLFVSMSSMLKTFYPITAAFNLSGYYEASTTQIIGSVISLILCGCLAVAILAGLKRRTH